MRQRKEKGLQSTTWKYLRRSKKKRHNVPDSHRALHMHVLERDFSIRAACVQHDCATCASMQRDAVTAAQSRFLATSNRGKVLQFSNAKSCFSWSVCTWTTSEPSESISFIVAFEAKKKKNSSGSGKPAFLRMPPCLWGRLKLIYLSTRAQEHTDDWQVHSK